MINVNTAKVLTTFSVGTNPFDVASTFNYPNVGFFAFITCQGGGVDLDGSVALYWSRYNGLQANVTGFKNPQGCMFDYGAACWVANSGGNTTSQLTLQFAGAAFAATIFPVITQDIRTGANPTSVTVEAYFPQVVGAAPQTVITANRGVGKITFIDAGQPTRPIFEMSIPGVREVATYMDQ